MSQTDTRIATTRGEKPLGTLEQVKRVIGTMPAETAIEYLNRAIVAFTLFAGAGDGAIASVKVKHVTLTRNCVFQELQFCELGKPIGSSRVENCGMCAIFPLSAAVLAL